MAVESSDLRNAKWILTTIASSWNLILLSSTVYKVFQNNHKKGIRKKSGIIAALILFASWFISYAIHTVGIAYNDWKLDNRLSLIGFIIVVITFNIGYLASYIVVLIQLYTCFKGTEYEISNELLYRILF